MNNSLKNSPSLITWRLIETKMCWGVIFLLGGGFALAKVNIRVLQRPIFLETTQGKPGKLLITPMFFFLARKKCLKLIPVGWTTQLKSFYVVFYVVSEEYMAIFNYTG